MTAWIRMLADEEASPSVSAALDLARAPSGEVGNVMRVHSLRPRTMIGHHMLYMSVLHCDDNALPLWLQETIASYVSILNKCSYSLTNHFSNARHLIANDGRADEILKALSTDRPEQTFAGAELAMLRYARKLTCACGGMIEQDLAEMREYGVDDGKILEVNQIVGYFNYANRLLNGLGVTLEGDVVGYYVSADSREEKRVRSTPKLDTAAGQP